MRWPSPLSASVLKIRNLRLNLDCDKAIRSVWNNALIPRHFDLVEFFFWLRLDPNIWPLLVFTQRQVAVFVNLALMDWANQLLVSYLMKWKNELTCRAYWWVVYLLVPSSRSYNLLLVPMACKWTSNLFVLSADELLRTPVICNS
jgi:hypothetical protein